MLNLPSTLPLLSILFLIIHSAMPAAKVVAPTPSPTSSSPDSHNDDAAVLQALIAFKDAITHDPFSYLSSWIITTTSSSSSSNTTAPPSYCSAWHGLLCDDHFHITSLNLNSCSLSGSISPSLALLPSLSILDLSYNNFSGPLPSSLSSSLTHLDLRYNALLSGHIPTSLILNSPNLQTLLLIDTRLSGVVPPEMWTHLPALPELVIIDDSSPPLLSISPTSFPSSANFAFCATIQVFQLAGLDSSGASFPSSLGDCQQLQTLILSTTGLQGSIPPSIWQLPHLQYLVIEDLNVADALDNYPYHPNAYNLHGSLPSTFGFCGDAGSTIRDMYIDGINLTGQIPASIGICSSLQNLDLSYTSLEGPIPSSLGNLTHLQTLYLQHNKLTGKIPAALGSCSQLTYLRLGFNSLRGSIPSELGMLIYLRELSLATNSLEGIVPVEALHNLTALQILRLSHNNLTGKIESLDLSKLPNLQRFSVHGNALEGGLPAGLTESKALVLFDVQSNKYLNGSLDNTATPDIAGLSKLRVLSVSYNQLSGDIPGWVWKLPSLQALDLSNNRFSGRFPATLTYLSNFKLSQTSDRNQTPLYKEVPVMINNTVFILNYVLSNRIYFDVSMNDLEGEIPESFGELKGLTGANLSHNRTLCHSSMSDSAFVLFANMADFFRAIRPSFSMKHPSWSNRTCMPCSTIWPTKTKFFVMVGTCNTFLMNIADVPNRVRSVISGFDIARSLRLS